MFQTVEKKTKAKNLFLEYFDKHAIKQIVIYI